MSLRETRTTLNTLSELESCPRLGAPNKQKLIQSLTMDVGGRILNKWIICELSWSGWGKVEGKECFFLHHMLVGRE